MRTYFFHARVITPGLEGAVTSGIFTSNTHPADPAFYGALTNAIAGLFAWRPAPENVVITNLNVLCDQ